MTNQNKINSILDMMNDLQENLLALPDDMLLSVDPRDNESIEEGMQFIKAFNTNLQIFSSSSKLFASLPTEKKFISNRGNPQFSLKANDLRVAEEFNGLFIEVNLSAKSLTKNIAALLNHFEIPPTQMRIYLREDRDA